MSASNQKSVLFLIMGIPLLGIALTTAFYFYVTSQGIQLGTQNQGTLIRPPQQLTTMLQLDDQGQPINWYQGESIWAMMVIGSEQCDTQCERKLYLVRQIHTMLGSNSPRVKMVYVNKDAQLTEQTQKLLQTEYARFEVVQANDALLNAWSAGTKDPKIASANFYLIDPAGWIMMYYTDEQNYKAIIKDLKFLLKNS